MKGIGGAYMHIWNNFLEKVVPWDGVVADPMLAIANGRMNGISYVNKFGRNPDADTGSSEDVWDVGGLYVPPTQARIHNIASTSAQDAGTVLSSGTITTESDVAVIDSTATFIVDGVAIGDVVLNDDTQDHSLVTAVDSETQLTIKKMHHTTVNSVGANYRIVTSAGTGATVAHIKNGLDTNMVEQTEFVVLNGTSNVATTNSYLRINRMHIHGAGSGGVNAGNITATAVTDATVTAQITAERGQTLMAHFTIPRGKSGYITHVHSSVNRPGGAVSLVDMTLYEKLWGDVNSGGDGRLTQDHFSFSSGVPLHKPYTPYKYISEFSDVWLRIDSVSLNNTDVSAGFDLILVDK